ncbi:MAG: hypothetical protein WBF87_16805, partial [Mesorhizobium sp.]
MKADRARPASRPLSVTGAAFLSILLAGCSGSGLESIDVSNPSYAAPTVTAGDAPTSHSDNAAMSVVPLTTEQEAQIGETETAFVPTPRPGTSVAAAQAELPEAPQSAVAAPEAAPAVQPAAAANAGQEAPAEDVALAKPE